MRKQKTAASEPNDAFDLPLQRHTRLRSNEPLCIWQNHGNIYANYLHKTWTTGYTIQYRLIVGSSADGHIPSHTHKKDSATAPTEKSGMEEGRTRWLRVGCPSHGSIQVFMRFPLRIGCMVLSTGLTSAHRKAGHVDTTWMIYTLSRRMAQGHRKSSNKTVRTVSWT